MDNYIQVKIELPNKEISDILIAELNEIGFEGFEEQEKQLFAFINETAFDEEAFSNIIETHKLHFTQNTIAPKNWNEEWEKSFEPVIIDDFCSIRASFHAPIKTTKHEIVITPKMSFGTGHHATTHLMITAISQTDCKEKTVIDFGTGTGVLAILSELCGATNVVAIDNDDWSIENARENIEANGCTKIKLKKSSSLENETDADIVLANINRNIILANFRSLKTHLRTKGILILSGLLTSDRSDIEEAAIKEDLEIFSSFEKDGWISLLLTY